MTATHYIKCVIKMSQLTGCHTIFKVPLRDALDFISREFCKLKDR